MQFFFHFQVRPYKPSVNKAIDSQILNFFEFDYIARGPKMFLLKDIINLVLALHCMK